MAEALGGRMNPTSGYENDVCIYIKRKPPDVGYPPLTVVDFSDDIQLIPWVRRHPDVRPICPAVALTRYLRTRLRRRVIFIPEQHCNYDNEVRPERPIKRVGVIGNESAFQWDEEDMRRRFRRFGLEYVHERNYKVRADVVRFYQGLDIQVVFRPWFPAPLLRDPLKLKNAGSFGIPTVAYPEDAYVAEFRHCFLPAMTPMEVVEQTVRLAEDPRLYAEVARRARERSSQYHVSRIADLYRQLAV